MVRSISTREIKWKCKFLVDGNTETGQESHIQMELNSRTQEDTPACSQLGQHTTTGITRWWQWCTGSCAHSMSSNSQWKYNWWWLRRAEREAVIHWQLKDSQWQAAAAYSRHVSVLTKSRRWLSWPITEKYTKFISVMSMHLHTGFWTYQIWNTN